MLFFIGTEQCNKAFQTLKELVTKAPVLAYPDFEKPFILDTDASDVAIGAILSKIIDSVEHPIGYFSRTLTGPEKKHCVTRRELLGNQSFLPLFVRPPLHNPYWSCLFTMVTQL